MRSLDRQKQTEIGQMVANIASDLRHSLFHLRILRVKDVFVYLLYLFPFLSASLSSTASCLERMYRVAPATWQPLLWIRRFEVAASDAVCSTSLIKREDVVAVKYETTTCYRCISAFLYYIYTFAENLPLCNINEPCSEPVQATRLSNHRNRRFLHRKVRHWDKGAFKLSSV